MANKIVDPGFELQSGWNFDLNGNDVQGFSFSQDPAQARSGSGSLVALARRSPGPTLFGGACRKIIQSLTPGKVHDFSFFWRSELVAAGGIPFTVVSLDGIPVAQLLGDQTLYVLVALTFVPSATQALLEIVANAPAVNGGRRFFFDDVFADVRVDALAPDIWTKLSAPSGVWAKQAQPSGQWSKLPAPAGVWSKV